MEKFIAYFKKNHLLIIGVIIAAVTLYLIWRSLKGTQSSATQPATIDPATSTPVTTSPTSTSPQTYAPSTVTNSSYAPVTSTTTSSIYSPTSNESINNSTSDSHNIVGAVTTDSHNYTGPITTTTTTTYNEQQYQLPTGLSGFSGSAGIPQNSQQPLQPASALAPANMPLTYQPIIPGSPGIPFALPAAVQARQEVQQLSQVLKQSNKPPTPITASNVNSVLPNWNAAQPIIVKPGQPAHAG